MTSLPLTQKPTDIVSLLIYARNLEFSEILAKTDIQDIPQLQESDRAIQKSKTIPEQEKDYRSSLLQQRLNQLSVIQSFQVFEEDYKDYKAHFSINGRGILIKIISPQGDVWEKQTQTFTNFQASQEFHLTINESLVKQPAALVQNLAVATKPEPLTEKEKRWQILNLLTEGDCVFYKGRIGTYKGVQECAIPSAWVLFADSQITEPINPLDLSPSPRKIHPNQLSEYHTQECEVCPTQIQNFTTKENFSNNQSIENPSSKLNLNDETTFSNYLTLSHQESTMVDFTQRHQEGFLPSLVFKDNIEKSITLSLQCQHLEKTAVITSKDNLKQLPLDAIDFNSKIIPFRPRILEGQLSKQEAEKIVAFINSNLRQLKALPIIQKSSNDIIRYYLVLLDEGKGYEQLGFKNMTALLNSDRIQGSRSNLQKQWQAGRIERDCLKVEPGTIPEDHCRKLAILKAYPEQVQKAYANAQKLAGNGRVTAKLVQQAVQEIAQNQGIELSRSKPQNKNHCAWNQNIVTNEYDDKVNLSGVNNFQDIDTEVCTQLEKVAKERNSSPEKLIVQALIKLVTQSTGMSDSEAFTKAIEIALTEIKTNIAA